MSACDQGPQRGVDTVRPPIHIVDANVGPSKPLPIDGVIELSFDRFLNPSTVNRQGVGLRDEFDQAPVSPVVTYDPVRRVVTLSNPSTDGKPWLLPGQPYKLVLPIPTKEGDFGLRAIDDAGLEGKGAIVIGFFTSAPAGRVPDPTATFCTDVFPIFQGTCAACHSSATDHLPPAGLDLHTESGVAFAKNRVANAANTGPRSGAGRPASDFFPVDMPIIDPGNPGNSFLLYKLLLAPPSRDGALEICPLPPTAVTFLQPPGDVALVLANGERERLGDYVLGMPMPASTPDHQSTPLGPGQLDRLRRWIAQGAKVETCGACP